MVASQRRTRVYRTRYRLRSHFALVRERRRLGRVEKRHQLGEVEKNVHDAACQRGLCRVGDVDQGPGHVRVDRVRSVRDAAIIVGDAASDNEHDSDKQGGKWPAEPLLAAHERERKTHSVDGPPASNSVGQRG